MVGQVAYVWFRFFVMRNRIPNVQCSCFIQTIDPKLRYIGDGVGNFVSGKKLVLLQLDLRIWFIFRVDQSLTILESSEFEYLCL